MPGGISVLYVDDEPDLLEVTKMFLEQSGVFRVDTLVSAKEALDLPSIRAYDAIISDYAMPGMDGIAFLKAFRERVGDTPFILFTGRGREEVVIEAINHGADFYLQKGGDPSVQFAELAHKIRQAVRRKEAERSLLDSERRLADIIEFLPDATFAIDSDGIVIAWNRAIEEMTGIPAAGMIGKGNYEYAIPFYGSRRPILIDLIDSPEEEIASFYSNLYRTGNSLTAETDLPHPKGHRISVLAKVCHLYNQNGEVTGAIESIRDITDRERDLERLAQKTRTLAIINQVVRTSSLQQTLEDSIRIVLSSALDLLHYDGGGVYLVDDEKKIARIVCSENLDPGFIREVDNIDLRTPPYDALFIRGEPVIHNDFESILPHAAALSGLRSIASIPIVSQGAVIGALNIGSRENSVIPDDDRDTLITIARELGNAITRMKAEIALRENERKFHAIFEKIHDALVLFTKDGCIDCNRQALQLFGYPSRESLLGLLPADVSPRFQPDGQDSETAASDHIRKVFEKGVEEFEWLQQRRDGSTFLADVLLSGFELDGKHVFLSSIREITERKRTEEALRQANVVVENSPVILFRWKAREGWPVAYVSQNVIRFGYTPEELISGSVPYSEMVFPDDLPRVSAEVQHHTESGAERFRQEYRLVTRSGDVRWVDDHTVVERDAEGRVTHYQGILLDITERRKAEDSMRENERKYRDLADLLPQMVFETDLDLKITYANRHARAVLGLTDDDIEQGVSVLTFIDPAQHAQIRERSREALSGTIFEPQEYTVLGKNGSRFPVLIYGAPLFRNSTFAGFRGIVIDISAWKTMEEGLRESEGMFRTVFENSPYPIAINSHPNNHFLEVNKALLDISGYSEEEILGKDPVGLGLLPLTEASKLVACRLRSGTIENVPLVLTAKGGTRIHVLFSTLPITIHNQPATLSIAAEVTKFKQIEENLLRKNEELNAACDHLASVEGELRKNYEELRNTQEELRRNEEKFRSFVESSSDLLYSMTPDGVLSYLSPKWTGLTGYSTGETLGKSFESLIHPEDIPPVLEFLHQVREGTQDRPWIEYRVRHKDGTWRWHSTTATPVHDQTGAIASIVGSSRDITDRRRIEDALRLANRQLGLLTGITRHDIQNKIMVILGYLKIAEMESPGPFLMELIRKIETATGSIRSQIEFTRIYQDLGVLEPRWVELDTILPQPQILPTVSLTADVGGISLYADAMLEKVFSNLLDNSFRHGKRVTEIRVSSRMSGEDLVVTWEDNGIGIPDDEKERIFDPGFGKNTGLGMYLAREILSLTGITIRETGEAGKGARFEITAPKGHYRVARREPGESPRKDRILPWS